MVIPLLLASAAAQHAPSAFYLDRLDLHGITQEFGQARSDQSVDGNPIKIAGHAFEHGVGTHATSEFIVLLRGNGVRFTSQVGVDDETNGLGTVRFLVFGDGKRLADSGRLKGGDAPKTIDVDVRNVRELRLVVRDAGDGIDHDHADWADAMVTLARAKPLPISNPKIDEPTMRIAHVDLHKVQINGARAVGTTPGNPFIFRIPATGDHLRYSAKGLPDGLVLDPVRGVITGSVRAPGRTAVVVHVRGYRGSDSRTITIVAGNHMLARTPPMGWNSWNVWGTSVDANKVRAAADAFNSLGLASFGYRFVNIDDAWEDSRDENGEIRPNSKFGDMAALAQYVHGTGLKLGIYSSPGPRTCGGYEGSYQHEFQDAKTYAKWGIDYLKYDWCSYGGIAPSPDLAAMQKPYILMRHALDDSGRDIVFSLCQYGMGDVFNWGHAVGGNLWRTTGDITDTWQSMSSIGFSHSEKAHGAGPGGWNDPDMLVVGKLGWGPSIRPTRLSGNEQITHISLWAMLAAPLIIGCDLTQLDPFTKDLLMNHDVIEIDQDTAGHAATRRKVSGDAEVWARPLWDGTYAVGLFNRGVKHQKVSVQWSSIVDRGDRIRDPLVRDLWRAKDVGRFEGGYSADVPAHGAVLLRVGTPQ